jgi:hypothetical protein
MELVAAVDEKASVLESARQLLQELRKCAT